MEAMLGKSEGGWTPSGGVGSSSSPAGGAVVGRGGRPSPEKLRGSSAMPRHESDSGAPPRRRCIFRAKELLSPAKMAAAATSLRGAGRGAAGGREGRAGAAAPGRRDEWWVPHFRAGMRGLLDGSVAVVPRFFPGRSEIGVSGHRFRAIAGDVGAS
jgi:hypothetical protein